MRKVQVKLVKFFELPHHLSYGFVQTNFGRAFLGCVTDDYSPKLCHLQFLNKDADSSGVNYLQKRFPKAKLQQDDTLIRDIANKIFKLRDSDDAEVDSQLEVALFGTEFQKRVWTALLKEVLWGNQCTYTDLALFLQQPRSVRAVANAVARNEISIVIPCHRIVAKGADEQKKLKYRWGAHIKRQLLDCETASKG